MKGLLMLYQMFAVKVVQKLHAISATTTCRVLIHNSRAQAPQMPQPSSGSCIFCKTHGQFIWQKLQEIFEENLTHCSVVSHLNNNYVYDIANVNSERWLAKSRVDITLCQHGKFPAIFLLKFFVLYYKRNIKHFFRIDIQLYQHSWKLEKLEIVWKHSALRASCFHTISRFSNFHSCWYNCISTRKMFYIS